VTTPLVVIDADTLGRQRTGDETYVENLLRELGSMTEDVRFAAVTRQPELVPAGIEALELPARSQIARMAVGVPRLLRRIQPDVAHFQHVLPPLAPRSSVITVHDLSFEYLPDVMSLRDRTIFRTLVPRSARRAACVLTVSEWTKRDLVEHYRLAPERIVVTPNGVDPTFSPDGPVRGDRTDLLFVGAIQPRKDPVTALEALALLDDALSLRFVGPEKLGGDEVRAAVARLGLVGRVEFLGHVAKSELAALYRGAACLVFPSRYEGFGLPVLEAMACGTPVVASSAGALPEVAGNAAVLVEPGNPEALASGVESALAQRERLVTAGLQRVRRFSWRESARRTLNVYRGLL
jgi:glycosyltransferase involved in cell wall biosynthesis